MIRYNFLDALKADCWTYKPQSSKTTTKAKARPPEAAHPKTPTLLPPQMAALAQTSSYTDGEGPAPTKTSKTPAAVTSRPGVALETASSLADQQ